MGGCMSSDVKGGKEAVGGVAAQQQETSSAQNDAVDFFYAKTGFTSLFIPLELSISASNLRDRDYVSKSDPMAVVYVKKIDGSMEELGRTEVVLNSLEPTWIQKINISYQFEIVQPLIFRIYDIDTSFHNIPVKAIKLKDQEFLGEGTCVLSEIVTKPIQSLTMNLHSNDGHGMKILGALTVHAEETVASKTAVEMTLRCSNLDNKDLFSKSDPFLRISRIVEAGGSVPICKTEVIENQLSPAWKPLSLTMQQFGSKENPLIIECFDYNSNGDHVLIGKLQRSVAELERLHIEKCGANFSRSSGLGGHEKVLKGQLFVDHYIEKSIYSFIDYISGGFELNFMVAIDFTASNGDPRRSNSLHYIDPSGKLNAYQQAIMDVGEVIQFYDADRRYLAWGFGGRMHDGVTSHCFNLTERGNDVEVEGVSGIMAAYAYSLNNVIQSGPTLFGQVISKAADIAARSLSSNERKYFVLLIITDGVLTDIAETKNALVEASDLPISVLIVGVGNADFKQMEELDADNKRRLESTTGRMATRDIVQFVPMREVHVGQISVVQSLLEELPGQFLTFVRSRDIKPNSVSLIQPT